ncbi:acyltransferase [Cryobacterium sp. 1639]|nr:acyltransferase [Cryobacterium sp. 1639]
MISGFVITASLLGEVRRTGDISLPKFYARRALRILPAATIVLMAVGALTILVLPRVRWPDVALEIAGGATFVVNWAFANSGVGYPDFGDSSSPVLHFWTLAVEGQFYLIWPFVLLGVVAFSKWLTRAGVGKVHARANGRRAGLIVLAVALLVIPSLAWSGFYTRVNPDSAYFVTSTRMWELGVGASVAVFATTLVKLPAGLRAALGWVGLAAIVGSAVAFDSATRLPGYIALIPVLGAAVVLMAGLAGSNSKGPWAVLSLRPVRRIGDISYALYLWHWPLVVFGTHLLGALSWAASLGILALSFVLAYLTWRFVERPLLRSPRLAASPGGSLRVGGTFLIATAVMTVAVLVIPAPGSPGIPAGGSALAAKSGADVLLADPTAGIARDSVDPYLPTSAKAAGDYPANYKDGCHLGRYEYAVEACTYGDLDSDYVVALVGDSHAAQWLPALNSIGLANGWRIEAYTKARCPFADVKIGTGTRFNGSCEAWNEDMMETLTGEVRPDLVVSSTGTYPVVQDDTEMEALTTDEALAAGMRRTWDQLAAGGVNVISIVDTPTVGLDVPECVSENPAAMLTCAADRDPAFAGIGQKETRAASGLPNVSVVTVNDYICPESLCAPVIGNVFVWRDTHHITATYSKTLANVLAISILATPSYKESSHG